jgi:hypothetical protein
MTNSIQHLAQRYCVRRAAVALSALSVYSGDALTFFDYAIDALTHGIALQVIENSPGLDN